MNKVGWLVNDCLTCIPETKTFWHDLLDWFPELLDKTNGYTNYNILANIIERDGDASLPDYIIRNATFFRHMDLHCKQVSLLQDCYEDKAQQIDVCNRSDVTVFNSNFTYSQYKDTIIDCDVKIIPLGVDFEQFNVIHDKRVLQREVGILPNSILFVGSSLDYPKGFSRVQHLINNTNYNFCLVMKDTFSINNPRVKVFNKITHDVLAKVYNSCDMLLCTSRIETQHLATIEAGACDIPILTTNIGALYDTPNGDWGVKVEEEDFVSGIEFINNNRNLFSPRQYFLNNKFDKESCKNKWIKLIQENI